MYGTLYSHSGSLDQLRRVLWSHGTPSGTLISGWALIIQLCYPENNWPQPIPKPNSTGRQSYWYIFYHFNFHFFVVPLILSFLFMYLFFVNSFYFSFTLFLPFKLIKLILFTFLHALLYHWKFPYHTSLTNCHW